jgi:hypothetical protein
MPGAAAARLVRCQRKGALYCLYSFDQGAESGRHHPRRAAPRLPADNLTGYRQRPGWKAIRMSDMIPDAPGEIHDMTYGDQLTWSRSNETRA